MSNEYLNADFTQRIVIDNNGNTSDDKPNWFAARVSGPAATDANKYIARFFIADWGSQIGNLSVAQWTPIGQANNPGLPVGTPPGTLELPVLSTGAPDAQASGDLVDDGRGALREERKKNERNYIEQLLAKHAGNVSAAAREAGIDRKHLHRLISRHGIDTDKHR